MTKTLKNRIEDNLTLCLLSFLLAGFLAGIGAYKGIMEIAGLRAISKSARIASEDERVISKKEHDKLTAKQTSGNGGLDGYASLYPDVVAEINRLLQESPYVHQHRTTTLKFAEGPKPAELEVAMTQVTEWYNPANVPNSHAYRVGITDDTKFREFSVYEVDPNSSDRRGSLVSKIDRDTFLLLPQQVQGNARWVNVTGLELEAESRLITVAEFILTKPSVSELPLLTNTIVIGQYRVVLDYGALTGQFDPGVAGISFHSKQLDATRESPSVCRYDFDDVLLPGHGAVVNWRYAP